MRILYIFLLSLSVVLHAEGMGYRLFGKDTKNAEIHISRRGHGCSFPCCPMVSNLRITFGPRSVNDERHKINFPECFPNLESLHFEYGRIGNINLEKIWQLPFLRELRFTLVDFRKFNDEEMQLISQFQHLEHLESIEFVDWAGDLLGVYKIRPLLQQLLPNTKITVTFEPTLASIERDRGSNGDSSWD